MILFICPAQFIQLHLLNRATGSNYVDHNITACDTLIRNFLSSSNSFVLGQFLCYYCLDESIDRVRFLFYVCCLAPFLTRNFIADSVFKNLL